MNKNPKTTKIAAIIIGVILSILIIVLAFKLMQSVFTRAGNQAPTDVVVSEITQSSVKISWSTADDTQGVIEYGTSPTALNFFAPEPTRTKSHLSELTLLSPSTTYYFQIKIGENRFDNGGVPWTFTTKGNETTQPAVTPAVSRPASGVSTPTPVQSIMIPDGEADMSMAACNETNCNKIKDKLGQGCSTDDYFKCIRKLTPSASISGTTTPTTQP